MTNEFLRGPRINPKPITGKETVAELVENAFLAYNAGRLAEGCRLYTERMLEDDVTVGMSLTGAMTPAGLGMSTIIPLIEAGFIDWIVSTGANLYHDAHFGLGMAMHKGTPFADDVVLREEGVVRIYDIFFHYDVLLSTDRFIREVSARPEFQRPMSTAEYHFLLGGYVVEREKALGISRKSVLGVAHACGVPIYTSSPGDSSIGMNVAEQALSGSLLRFDVSADVNETSAIVFAAKTHGGSVRRATTTTCSSPMRGPTPAACRARRRRRRSAGARSTPTNFPTRWCATSTTPWASRSSRRTRSPGASRGRCGACITSAAS